MNRLASPAQLRASLARWTLFAVPGVALLGLLSLRIAGNGPDNLWFAGLDKPAFAPPPIALAAAWPVFYVLLGLALAQVCAAWGARYRTPAIVAFVLQLALALAWSPVFYGRHELALGLYLLLALAVALGVTTVLFWRVRRTAGLLLLPCLAWIVFLAALDWQLLRFNPEADGAEVTYAVQRIPL